MACHGRGSLKVGLVNQFAVYNCLMNLALVNFGKIYSVSPPKRLFLTLQYPKSPKISSDLCCLPRQLCCRFLNSLPVHGVVINWVTPMRENQR